MGQDTFPLPPNVTEFLTTIRNVVVDGVGLALIQSLPVTEWDIRKTASIYLAIGTMFGATVSQNGKGHILGHVKVSLHPPSYDSAQTAGAND